MYGNPKKDQVVYQFVTGFPAASSIAQTWNVDLARQVGDTVGHEMAAFGVTYWLAPALNIVRNPRIWIAPCVTSMITGPIATCIFRLQMNGAAVSSGMGTCGLVGQIGVYTGWVNDVANGTKAAITAADWIGLILVSFVLPAVICPLINVFCRKMGWVKDGDMTLA